MLRSLFDAGYVLQVDTAFGPRAEGVRWAFDGPVTLLVHAGDRLLGGDVAGKLVVALSLFLCGLGAMVATRRLPWWARGAAALLATLNPWVYDRLADGQWGVVAAAGFLFLWVAAWDRLQRRPGPLPAAAAALAGVGAVALSQNFAGMVVVLAVAALLWTRPWRAPDRSRLRWTAIALGGWAVLELYGILPFFLHTGPGTYTSVSTFGRADFAAFRATPDGRYGVLAALAGLYGHWGERTGRIPVATAGNPWWPVATAVLIALTLYGAWHARRTRAWLLVAGLVGLGLSAVTATSWGLDAVVRIAQRVPLVAAYRDVQKWDALWLLALVLLGAEAVAALSQRSRRAWLGPVAATGMTLATLLPAGVNQIQQLPRLTEPVAYPADWYQAAAYLQRNVPATAPVAVLPWHLYEPLSFAGRLVANPARVFFPGTLILPDDPELPDQPGPLPSPGNIGAESLGPESHQCALADGLRGVDAHWVVVEQTVGTQDVLDRLAPCGFTVVEGGGGGVSVLRG